MSDNMISVEEARAVLELDSAPLAMRQTSRTIVVQDEQVKTLSRLLVGAEQSAINRAAKLHHIITDLEGLLDVVKHETWLYDDEGQFPETVQLGNYVVDQLTRILEGENNE